MSELKLTKTRLKEGAWEGLLSGVPTGSSQPILHLTFLEQQVGEAELREIADGGGWSVRIPIPVQHISDGVQTFLIQDAATGETLNSFSLIAGEALGDDLRAEVDLLRAELDMLKRAFRRHCLDTA